MTALDNYTRAVVALQMITTLTAEKHTLMNRYWQSPMYEHPRIQKRLQQIEIELAHAQEERRRARAGAPPAPMEYDPLAIPRLETNHNSSIRPQTSLQKIEEIKADYQCGHGMGKLALAEKYGLSPQQIRRVLRDEGTQPHPAAKLNEAQVRDILQRYQESNGRRGIIKELADVFHVRKSTICDIVSRRTWRNVEFEVSGRDKRVGSRTK